MSNTRKSVSSDIASQSINDSSKIQSNFKAKIPSRLWFPLFSLHELLMILEAKRKPGKVVVKFTSWKERRRLRNVKNKNCTCKACKITVSSLLIMQICDVPGCLSSLFARRHCLKTLVSASVIADFIYLIPPMIA